MHDTFLNENIYETVVSVCRDNSIKKVNSIIVAVNPDSHVTRDSLRELFSERNSTLVSSQTEIIVEKTEMGRLTAVIKQIDGETLD